MCTDALSPPTGERNLRSGIGKLVRPCAPLPMASALVLLSALVHSPPTLSDAQRLFFTNIAADPSTGIGYARGPSANKVILDQLKEQGIVNFAALNVRARMPGKPRGAPGVAILDYDRDGDLDIYVSNGPGRANSLYSNQYVQTGVLQFVDVARDAGVGLVADDSSGVCFGDMDNDGDQDLIVLNLAGPNRLLRNRGDGRFVEEGEAAGIADRTHHPSSCALGDVNGDGYLDLVVGNTFDNWDHRLPLMTFDNDHLMEANQLFISQGGMTFQDASTGSGIENPARVTWALALVDYDADGDVDLVTADDQGAKAPAKYGGVDHGYVRLFRNDGTGHFTNETMERGTDRPGAWMGLAFGDFDRDGRLDIYATNTGYYFPRLLERLLGFPEILGEWASGAFMAGPDGHFRFPGVGALVGVPFGWGVAAVDYDNDNDTDIIYHGGIDMGAYVDASNPGTVLRNDGMGNFDYDEGALDGSVDHTRRSVQGLATGDLDNDGFVDIVTVASQIWPKPFPLVPYLPPFMQAGSVFDATASIWPTFAPVDPVDWSQGFRATGLEPADGDLAIEINSGNKNHWVKVRTLGTVGLTDHGRANRDGVGALVRFHARGGETDIHPVLAGSSYASQGSLELLFGLGRHHGGTLEVLWPGGVRNRLYGVRAGEMVVFPEIPCGFDDHSMSGREYQRCLHTELDHLVEQGVIDRRQGRRFFRSGLRARHDNYRKTRTGSHMEDS